MCCPVQDLLGTSSIGHQYRRIPCATGADRMDQFLAGDLPHGCQYLTHGDTCSRPQIERDPLAGIALAKAFHSQHMRRSQIHYMDVVPDTCSVKCRIVTPHNTEI